MSIPPPNCAELVHLERVTSKNKAISTSNQKPKI